MGARKKGNYICIKKKIAMNPEFHIQLKYPTKMLEKKYIFKHTKLKIAAKLKFYMRSNDLI